MKPEQKELWNKIQNFELDDPESLLTFTTRLARENGWELIYTLRVVEEYKRFIFLLCVSEHPLTPSDQVDQVWHLHLLYTQSYWIEFCKNTIHREIHHGPTKGGKKEGDKYTDWYNKTKQFYEQVFAQTPPDDIWPLDSIRFNDINFQRINISKNWIIRKPKFIF